MKSMPFSFLEEFQDLKPLNPEIFPPENLQVSLIIPAKKSGHALERSVRQIHDFLHARYPDAFEIILVPNPNPGDPEDPSLEIATEMSRRYAAVRTVPHSEPKGKGAAVRTGVVHARGKWIFLTDADLPYDLDFFDRAAHQLQSGFDLVSGNRRLASSYFHVPVRLLPLAFGRHRLGLGFNFFVRTLLGIQTTDTQAGIKALSRRLAQASFFRQCCPGFLFDLEIFLTARGHRYSQIALPVVLHLNDEKSTVRILKESVLVAFWLNRILWRKMQKIYDSRKKQKGPHSDILTP